MAGKKKRRRRSAASIKADRGSSMARGRAPSTSPAARGVRGLPLDQDLSAVHRQISRAVKDPELRRLMRQLERETAEREEGPQ